MYVYATCVTHSFGSTKRESEGLLVYICTHVHTFRYATRAFFCQVPRIITFCTDRPNVLLTVAEDAQTQLVIVLSHDVR